MPSTKKPAITKKEFQAIAIAMISSDPHLKGLWLGEAASKVIKTHVLGSGTRWNKKMNAVLKRILYALRGNTKREVTRKTIEAAGLSMQPKPAADQTQYFVRKIVSHDYNKEGCVALVRWEETTELMKTLPKSVVTEYWRRCLGPGSAFERMYVEAEAKDG